MGLKEGIDSGLLGMYFDAVVLFVTSVIQIGCGHAVSSYILRRPQTNLITVCIEVKIFFYTKGNRILTYGCPPLALFGFPKGRIKSETIFPIGIAC